MARPRSKPLAALYTLKGRVAVVTGGCRDLGRDMAMALGEAGACLAITSREATTARRAARALARTLKVEVLGLGLDITREAEVVAAFRAAHQHFGRIDILVNNAGGHVPGSSGNVTGERLDVWRRYLDANLTGTFLCLREAARYMRRRRRGSIINIASVSSLVGRDRAIYAGCPGMKNAVPYTASKAGVLGLTVEAAADLARDGIRVNAISPGGFERGQPARFIAAYARRTMLGRMGRAGQDLKGPVVFLASEAAAYVTGHNLVVDGGFTRFK